MSEIDALALQMRADSRRWFPQLHEGSSWDLVVAYTLGLAGEAGEVANLVKKVNRAAAGARAPKTETVVSMSDRFEEELADVLVYLLLLSDELGVDLVEAYRAKRAANVERWGTV